MFKDIINRSRIGNQITYLNFHLYQIAQEIFGWKREAEFLIVEYKIEQQIVWKEAGDELLNYTSKESGFNPQKPIIHTSSSNVLITSELAKNEGYHIYSFSQMLEQLRQKKFVTIFKEKQENYELAHYQQRSQSFYWYKITITSAIITVNLRLR
ncbi:unnamed protein product [Paramecium primaurelia]|uniref:Uncharacterized protein n=1 Tax=Paramecium primaurelia TaxID=5886 RepID=A0A8S1PUC1_PARPR|nr:unnamed protein product [Paramecium primaurelia]